MGIKLFMKKNYKETDKRLFFEVFGSRGKNSWTLERKKSYIYALKKFFDLKKNELVEKIIKEDVSEIFNKIIKYDDSLKIFKDYLKKYETHARKSIGIYDFTFSKKELDNIKKINDIPYNFKITKDWEPIELKKDDNEITITLAKGSYNATNLIFDNSNFSDEKWDDLKKEFLELTNNKYSTLKTIKTELMEETRVISRVKFNLKKELLEFGTDFSYLQENGTRTTIEKNDSEKVKILNQINSTLKLENKNSTQIHNSFLRQENNILNDKIFNKLLNLNEDNLIIIPITHQFYNENKTIEEYNEIITTDQRNQRLEEILKKVKNFYMKKSTLKGFLLKHHEHNTSQATITDLIMSEDSTKTTKFHGFAILIRDTKDLEKDSNSDKMKGKVIDKVIFDFDINDQKINITNNYYSEEIYETIISKVFEFSK